MPQYDEIAVKALWPELKKDANFLAFFPSVYPKNKGPPREYFFNILNTLYPDYLEKIMAHADKQRYSATGETMKKESINISDSWQEQLKAMPYLSCKFIFAKYEGIFLCQV